MQTFEENKYHLSNEAILKNFLGIIKIKSISRNERSLFDHVKKRLESLGIKVSEDKCGVEFGGNTGNMVATYIPEVIKNNAPIFLCAHLDTVFHADDIEPEISQGRITNKNAKEILGSDDKAAVAAILEAITFLVKNRIPTGIVYIIFTVGEEVGLFGSKFLNMDNIEAQLGFVFDSDGDIGAIINKAPYHNRMDFTVTGKASHAGIAPEKGINSIKVAASAIAGMPSGRIDEETTCNIGIIKGGVETNIVPEKTEINAEARSLNEDKLTMLTEEITEKFKKTSAMFGAGFEARISREYDGYEINRESIVVKIAEYALKKIGIQPILKTTGGGSDTNNFNSKGRQAVNLSSGMENCHSGEEYIKVEELEKLARLIIEICRYNKEEI